MKKTTIIMIIMLLTVRFVQAQDFNTNQKLSDQLKRGAVPGLQFAPAKTKRTVAINKSTEKHNESFIAQVRKGTAPGMQFKAGATGARLAAPCSPFRHEAKSRPPLASETDQPKLQQAKPVTQTVVPTQETAPAKQ